MARKSKEQELADIHAESLIEMDAIQMAVRDERIQCLEDRRFYSIAGAMWEGPLSQQFENKPKMEFNKVHLAVIRIFSEYRNNRITVDFVPKDGSDADELADTCDGLYRADEQDSVAEEAYDNAFEEAVGGGFGAFRLRTKYEEEYDYDEDEEDERKQRICFEPIFDADSSVFFDLGAKRQDKSDAKRCYVLTSIPVAQYIAEYEDDPASWPKEINNYEFDWTTPDVVVIAERYSVEEKKEKRRVFEALDGTKETYTEDEFEDDETLEETLRAIGSKELEPKTVKCRKIRKIIMSGNKVLEDCGYIAGKHIPVVPVYGKRWFVDGIERCMGHVRLAKDAQRLANMQRSKLAEISALSSVEKPYFTPEQVAGHTQMHADDNIKNFPYLLVNSMTDQNGQPMPAGPVAYTRAPNIPPAMAALLQITEQDMKDVLGNQEQGEQMVSNIASKTVEMIQQRLDMQTYIYMSNMAKAYRRAGQIWLSMAKDTYVEPGRKMKTVGSQGETGTIELMRPMIGEDGAEYAENDLSKASLDVYVDVGPSSNSKRSATVRSLTGLMTITQDQETLQVLGAMAMMNMEGEGIGEVRDYFRQKLVKMGVMKPTEEEAKAMAEAAQNAKPDPNAQFLQAAAEEATAKAAKARADTVKTVADSELSRAKTIETLAGVDMASQEHAINLANQMSGMVQESAQPVVQDGNQPAV